MTRQHKVPKEFCRQDRMRPLYGINCFQRSLDKIFFTNSKIKCKQGVQGTLKLIIDLNCNFKLINALYHFRMGSWGGLHNEGKKLEVSPFEQAFIEVQELNNGKLDIAEVYINLLDTTLIISKIKQQCISFHLNAILSSIEQNFIYFTKGLHEIPYEIFIPVFQLDDSKGKPNVPQKGAAHLMDGYFDYWGLYFLSEKNQEPIIYDVHNKCFIDRDLKLSCREI